MPVEYGKESNYAKEMRKHEATHTEFGPPGRPYVYRHYDTRMYKAERVDGKHRITDAQTAHDEHEQRNLESRGFVYGGQAAAIEALTKTEFESATGAAEREWQIQHGRVSEKATAEVRQAEASVSTHLADVPVTPIKPRRKPGRKPKTETHIVP